MYPMSRLFWYRPLFTTMLIIANLIFFRKCAKKKYFALRLSLSIVLLLELSLVFPLFTNNAFYISFMFIFFWAATFLLMRFCFEGNIKNLFYMSMMGYTTEHIAYELYLSIITMAGINTGGNSIYSFDENDVFLSW